MFDGLLLPWQQIYHLAFYSIFGTTDVSSKLYFVEICYVSEKLWLFNHKRADFWLPNFGFIYLFGSLLSLLNMYLSAPAHLLVVHYHTTNFQAKLANLFFLYLELSLFTMNPSKKGNRVILPDYHSVSQTKHP